MLPDSQELSNSSGHVISSFPLYSPTHLCQPDLIFMFRLVSLHTSHLLQTPTGLHELGNQTKMTKFEATKLSISQGRDGYENIVEDLEEKVGNELNKETCCERVLPSFDLLRCTGCFGRSHSRSTGPQTISHAPLNLKGLLEAIRKGRVFLLNGFQVGPF
jgi:hypothetical protein